MFPSNSFQSSLIEHLPLATFVIDAGHRVLQWNKACEALTGIPATELVGTGEQWRAFFKHKRPTLADLVADGCTDPTRYYPVSHKKGEGFHAEGWYRALNGNDRYLTFYAAPIYGSDGALIAVIETVEDITERKRTEESLRKLSCAVEQSPTVVVITDAQGIIEYVNPRFTNLTGYLPEEVIGQRASVLHSGLLPPEHFQSMWSAISQGREWRGEFYNRRKNGDCYWESASVSPVRDEAGVITHYIALKEEITERKVAAERIRDTLSLLNATLEATADGILVRDLSGRCITYNRNFIEMWDFPESALATRNDRLMRMSVAEKLKDPDGFLAITDVLYRCPDLETRDILELKDGRVFERVSKPQVIDNEIVGRVISFRDITERVRAEEALRESAERYRTLVDNVDLGITLIDSDFRVVMTNIATGGMFNKAPREFCGKECFREFEKRSEICGHCPGKKAMETGQPATVQTEGVRDDGSTISVRIKAFPILDGNGKATGFIEVIQDITEQLQAERDKELLEAQLRQSQKFEAIGTLAGGIAHDFNNFLTVITAFGTLMERRMAPDDPSRGYLEKIFSASDKAANLTKGLLAYSRKQPLAMRPEDLREVIGKLYNLLDRLLGEDIHLTLHLPDQPLIVLADSLQIDQVLMNLTANARDAMPQGGLLRIEAGLAELDAEFLKNHGYGMPGTYAVVTVSDTGEGIDVARQDRIFEPFFTTKEVGKGSGLGLSMVYGIIKQHNGYINVYSEPEKGTTFRIYLPLTGPALAETSPADVLRPKGGDETILLVEDDPEIRSSMKLLLEEDGYRILEAVDGEDGIEEFREHQDEIRLLLIDVMMPKKNGREVYESVRAIAPDIKAVFMSGYPADILSARGVLDEDVHLVSKPISINALSAKIREVLGQGR